MVPALVVATAAPAAAGSAPPPSAVYTGGQGTRIISTKQVVFALQFVASAPVTVSVIAISPNDGWHPLPVVLAVAPGQTTYAFTLSRGNNAAGAYTITYSVNGGAAQTGAVVVA
jgi:hypothetical protein